MDGTAMLGAQGSAGGPGGARSARDWEFALQTGRTPRDPAEQKEFCRFLCRQLEAATVNIMLQTARRSSPEKALLSGGFAGSMFQGMADEEYSRLIAARGGFGIGDAVFQQLTAERAYGPQTVPAGTGTSRTPERVR